MTANDIVRRVSPPTQEEMAWTLRSPHNGRAYDVYIIGAAFPASIRVSASAPLSSGCIRTVYYVFAVLTLAVDLTNTGLMNEPDSPQDGNRSLNLREDAVRAAADRIESDLAAARARVERLEAALETHTALLRLFASGSDYLDVAQPQRGTIREMLGSVLRAEGGPISVREMTARMSDAFGVDIPRTSVSPVLKRMEEDDDVLHVGRKWKFNEKGPSAATDGPWNDVATNPTKRRKTIMLG